MNRHLHQSLLWISILSIWILSGFASTTSPQDSDSTASKLFIKKIQRFGKEQLATINSQPYGVGDSLVDVEADWGLADDKGIFAASYWGRFVRILYDHSTPHQTITAMEDIDPKLSEITYGELIQTIGKPSQPPREVEGTYEVMYTDHKSYKIIYSFESSSSQKNIKNIRLQSYLVSRAD